MPNIAQFVREVRQEGARVTWPTRKEVMVSTLVVFVMVLISSLFFLAVDSLIGWVLRLLLG